MNQLGRKTAISDDFSLTKRRQQLFQDINDEDAFNLIYFGHSQDSQIVVFRGILKKCIMHCEINGVIVTYACRSSIKKCYD
jgi:hypothetical protein